MNTGKCTRSVGASLLGILLLSLAGSCGDDSVEKPIPNTNAAPTCTITTPSDSSTFVQGQTVSFVATASDAEDGPLTGSSLVWTSDKDGQIGTGSSFGKSNLSVNTHAVALKATDSDGRSDADTVTVFVTANQFPSSQIISPSNGSILSAGQPIVFEGMGIDPEDGALTGASLVWTSDKDGQIGTGESFSTSSLSVNTHRITLTVTDSGGLARDDNIDIGVTSWELQSSGTNVTLRAVCFTDADTGTVVGSAGTILRTTNGGTTWTPQTSGTGSNLEDVFFTDASNGWVVGRSGRILHTTDGGANWNPQTTQTSEDLLGVHFYASAGMSWGHIVGSNGAILRTTDAGTTWTPQTSGVGTWLLAVYVPQPDISWAVGTINILYTANGGDVWVTRNPGLTGIPDFTGVYFLGNSGVVVGTQVGDAVVVRTANAGASWTESNMGSLPGLYDVSFSATDPVDGMAVGEAGTVITTANLGTTWQTRNSGLPLALYGVCMVDRSTATVVGQNGLIAKTTTGGQ